jgi:hypothetical protein
MGVFAQKMGVIARFMDIKSSTSDRSTYTGADSSGSLHADRHGA